MDIFFPHRQDPWEQALFGKFCHLECRKYIFLYGKLMLYDLKATKSMEPNLTHSLSNSLNQTSVTTCVFNHNAQMIITGNSDGKVRIFDLRKRDCISSWSLTEKSDPILTLQMSSDETCIYALSSEGQFSAWSFIQTSQKIFDTKIDDPYFNSDLYGRSCYGKW